ncbi:hypothetical protein PV327_004153 [Microctonus hyperodae]|uniref:Uncharacterized protein n=1 Tax=Microctonus hyperodae TaxID=165561 RepID=A0AA39KMD8_MICHY|nr:hypothetical protein PV327_004153 [Microctonus hyperodae]
MLPGTTGPKVAIFQRIQSAWPNVNKTNYKSGLEEDSVNKILHDKVDEIKQGSVMAKNALDKFKNHLWYLSPELAVLALFDTDASVEVKLRIVKNLEIANDQVEKLSTFADEDGDCDFADDPPHTKRYQTKNTNEILDKEIDF